MWQDVCFIFRLTCHKVIASCCVLYRYEHCRYQFLGDVHHQHTIWWTATQILFLKNLSLSLMKDHLVSRSQIPSLPRDVSAFLEKYRPLSVEDDGDGIAGRPPKKWGSCFICGWQKNSSASMKCDQCNRFICKQHSKKQIICANCGDANIITSSECE